QCGDGCDACFQQSSERRGYRLLRRLGGDARLYVPALFRLLRLFRHGHWRGADFRDQAAAQFPLALSGAQYQRFLAALAYDAVALSPRLSLPLARRRQARQAAALREPLHHHGAWWSLAWACMDLHALGGSAWADALHQ